MESRVFEPAAELSQIMTQTHNHLASMALPAVKSKTPVVKHEPPITCPQELFKVVEKKKHDSALKIALPRPSKASTLTERDRLHATDIGKQVHKFKLSDFKDVAEQRQTRNLSLPLRDERNHILTLLNSSNTNHKFDLSASSFLKEPKPFGNPQLSMHRTLHNDSSRDMRFRTSRAKQDSLLQQTISKVRGQDPHTLERKFPYVKLAHKTANENQFKHQLDEMLTLEKSIELSQSDDNLDEIASELHEQPKMDPVFAPRPFDLKAIPQHDPPRSFWNTAQSSGFNQPSIGSKAQPLNPFKKDQIEQNFKKSIGA